MSRNLSGLPSLATVIMGASMCAWSVIGSATTFMPANDLDKEDNVFEFLPNVSEAQFKAIVTRGKEIYGPIVEAFGGQLEIEARWTDSTVNASAQRDSTNPDKWSVTMYGGLARRPEITPDGFVMVLCHEIGHQLGGFPFVEEWAANEGQSDYFAALACSKLFWAGDTAGNDSARQAISGLPKQRCDDVWHSTADRIQCYRNMLAAKAISDLLAALEDETVAFDTPDTSAVTATNNDHPAAQCRLDTYMAGALCTAHFDQEVIPVIATTDRNSRSAELQSASYTCTAHGHYAVGLRPTCWFKPRL